MKLFYFLSFLIINLAVNSLHAASSTDPHTCVRMTEENSPMISPQLYKDLVGSLDWDIEQHDLIANLSSENNYIMLCVLYQGFSFDNFVDCSGEGYSKVIDVYTTEFIKLKFGMVDGVISMLKSHNYDSFEVKEHLNRFRRELMDDLNENKDPVLSLEKFQKDVEHWEEYDAEAFVDMFKKLKSNYYIYVALKKIIKGYILLTIRCLQDYFEMVGPQVPEGENILLYNKTRLDDTFPDEEIERVFTNKKEEEKELEDLSKGSSASFNVDMAKQHRYQHLLSMYVANAKISEDDLDKLDTPQNNFKRLIKDSKIKEAYHKHIV